MPTGNPSPLRQTLFLLTIRLLNGQDTLASGHRSSRVPHVASSSWVHIKVWLRTHVFRAWTAAAVLAAYVYDWIYFPEVLTWWKRTTTKLIEAGCSQLPYPWGDRIEATLGNFGLWVQITLAIIVFRILVWLLLFLLRSIRTTRHPRPDGPISSPAEDRP